MSRAKKVVDFWTAKESNQQGLPPYSTVDGHVFIKFRDLLDWAPQATGAAAPEAAADIDRVEDGNGDTVLEISASVVEAVSMGMHGMEQGRMV